MSATAPDVGRCRAGPVLPTAFVVQAMNIGRLGNIKVPECNMPGADRGVNQKAEQSYYPPLRLTKARLGSGRDRSGPLR
jgi:hypothetical protein